MRVSWQWRSGLPTALGPTVYKSDLDGLDLFSGPQWLVLEFPPITEVFGIGLLDKSDNFLTRMQVPVSAVPIEVWLHVPDPTQLLSVIIQNWISPLAADILIRSLWVVREKVEEILDATPEFVRLALERL